MTLTKTQAGLLRQAAHNSQGMVTTYFGHITSHRRQRPYGGRLSDAACKLRDAGLLEHMATHTYNHPMSHRFGSDVGHEAVWKLTPMGREIVKTLERSQ